IVEEEVYRIDIHSIADYLIVQMRSGRGARVTNITDQVAPFHALSFLCCKFAQVGIAGYITVSVVDFDVPAITMIRRGCNHPSVSGRINGSSTWSGKVNSIMHLPYFINRVDTPAKS